MSTISVITLTRNEERNIGPCLESVRWADEILVVDSGSTDRTQEIARRYTEKIHTLPWPGYGAARNFAIAKARGDWILWLDADERVTPGLAGEISGILTRDTRNVNGFAVARRAYFLGRWIRHCGWYPSRDVRIFRRGHGHFTETNVHERLIVDGATARTEHDILHYTDPDLHHYLDKFNSYTGLAAADLETRGRRFHLADLLVRPVFQFLKMYIVRGGFLDGIPGLILCVLSSAYVFTKYAKLWESQQPTNREGES
jgi:glycosyltransferase involved in cell wall biosynthesis